MIALSTSLQRKFRTAIRARGAAYFRAGRVQIDKYSTSRVAASVRGTMVYAVELGRRGSAVEAACTCASFDYEMCKHIWAVVLAADQRQLLQGDERGTKVTLTDGAFEWGTAAGGEHGAAGDDAAAQEDALEPVADDAAQHTAFEPAAADGAPDAPPVRSQAPSLRVFAARVRTADAKPASNDSPRSTDWRGQIAKLDQLAPRSLPPEPWPASRELLYVVDAAATLAGGGMHFEILCRDLKKDGTRAKPKGQYLPGGVWRRLRDADDRHALAFVAGGAQVSSLYEHGYLADPDGRMLPYRYRLADPQPELLLPIACRTGRCYLRRAPDEDPDDWLPLAWDAGEPWQFRIDVARDTRGERYELRGRLERDGEQLALEAPVLLTAGGLFFMRDRAARYTHDGAFAWVALLRKQGVVSVPFEEGDELVEALVSQPALPALTLPPELRYEQIEAAPLRRLAVTPIQDEWRTQARVLGELSFDYGGTIIPYGRAFRGVAQAKERRVLLRNEAAEREAVVQLEELGWRSPPTAYGRPAAETQLELAASALPRTVRVLTQAGWRVEAEGKLYRSPGRFDLRVTSGVDWFELHGAVDFGEGGEAPLPRLLAAVRRGEMLVRLGDGSFGLLPERWLERYGLLADLGRAQDDHVRFERSQAGLLDALLAAEPEARFDEVFEKARAELAAFGGVRAVAPPRGFSGTLRGYQQEALGWFEFLRDFRFGGCLADDMGLGKTVQVLALLEHRREAGIGAPSLVVVPKSLVFNWKEEAARFAPQLRVLDHTGPSRGNVRSRAASCDVVVTTYGTLRNDVADLKQVAFDYVILDEAQAIKNATSGAAKAARLLKSKHRLALSGTPIENHLGELFSLFEFLNPGMLGTAAVFKSLTASAAAADSDGRKLLARVTRPFLLRRTKAQVLRDLPPKVEQTIYVEMEKKQRKLYDELREHYRDGLLKRIARDGIGRAKIQILEALLRLRQAAIHPGLIDKRRSGEPSAKLDMLLPQLEQVVDEGHKTLVFSQFTSMLAIVRERLDAAGVRYEYLDGGTKDREACVRRFQGDPDCRLFLISLKAGGLGLNLTAAQYVFLLDPWWNPAVEAQAIDRAHRIGQHEQVFAYRIIARDTIEEKVLALQAAKRELADAIIGADNALIRKLTKDDLELLLS